MREVKTYWSDILNKEFKTSTDCLNAEKEFIAKENTKTKLAKEKSNAKKKVDEARDAFEKASKVYRDTYEEYLNKYCTTEDDCAEELENLIHRMFS